VVILVAGPYRSGTNDDPDLLAECRDGVLRIDGESRGAEEMVDVARAHGKRVFFSVAEVQSP
jgi:hypothetical protein